MREENAPLRVYIEQTHKLDLGFYTSSDKSTSQYLATRTQGCQTKGCEVPGIEVIQHMLNCNQHQKLMISAPRSHPDQPNEDIYTMEK
jgi:hypothetical protein